MTYPANLATLTLVVFMLGLKHGFDADHLATIDGLTRYNSRRNLSWARYCGALFSLGHGLVVIAVALMVSLAYQQWQTPPWLEFFGTWVSIFALGWLGIANIHAVYRTPAHELVSPIGVKGQLLSRFAKVTHPALVFGVGALFALSFDTISQAALFSVTAIHFGSWQHALMLGVLFTLGMLTMDGLNGLWIAHLLKRADQVALTASRLMGWVVGALSLMIAALGAIRYASPPFDEWSGDKELLFGALVVFVILLGYFSSIKMSARRDVITSQQRLDSN